MAFLHLNLCCSNRQTCNITYWESNYHNTQIIANHLIDELKDYMNWKTHLIETKKTY